MSVHDDDLLPDLRRSTDPVDRRLAWLLGRLVARRPAAPRASESLAAFLAEASTASAPLDPSTDTVTPPVASTGHDHVVVQLGRPAQRSSPMRSRLIPLKKVLKTGLLAKVMIGTTVALTGVGAAAATGNLPGAGDDNVVVVTPSDDTGGSTTPSDDPLGVIDLDDEGEDDADDDADDDGPDDDDQGEDGDDQGEDEPGDDDGDNSGPGGDDQGDDDDQGENDDDQDEDEPGDDDGDSSGPGGDDADDDDADDDDADEDGDNSDDDDEGEDDESGDD